MHNIVLSIIIYLAGITFIFVAVPLFLGKIPPNSFYGIRIPKAFESDASWYKINRVGGGKVIVGGAILLIAATALLFAPQIHNRQHRALVVSCALGVAIVGGAAAKISSSKATEREKI